MANIPVIVLAGQSNAAFAGIDNRLFELLSAQGSAFELVKVASAGTSLFATSGPDWDPASAGELTDALVGAVNAAMARVRASGNEPVIETLWVQGEADMAEPHASQYMQQLSAFIAACREQTGDPGSLFAISVLPDDSTVRGAQFAVAASTPGVITIETQGAGRWDRWHYDKPTREGIAERFIAATAAPVPDVPYSNALPGPWTHDYGDHVLAMAAPFADYVWSSPRERRPVEVRTFAGDDRVVTGNGADLIRTLGNNDVVWSHGGNDDIDLGQHDDVAHAGPGDDLVLGGEGSDRVYGDAGNDRLLGGTQADLIVGGTGADTIDGGEGPDTVRGDGGDDAVAGGPGADRIIGGPGVDQLTGGAGADVFVFTASDFDATGPAAFDTIADFDPAQGDVLRIAPFALSADHHFIFIGDGAFSGTAGEIRVAVSPAMAIVEGDRDGDGVADLAVGLIGVQTVAASDLRL